MHCFILVSESIAALLMRKLFCAIRVTADRAEETRGVDPLLRLRTNRECFCSNPSGPS